MKRQSSKGGSQNTFVDHIIRYRISLWPKTAKKHDFCTGVMDGRTNRRTDRRTDGRTDRPSYRDARTHLKSCMNFIDFALKQPNCTNESFCFYPIFSLYSLFFLFLTLFFYFFLYSPFSFLPISYIFCLQVYDSDGLYNKMGLQLKALKARLLRRCY